MWRCSAPIAMKTLDKIITSCKPVHTCASWENEIWCTLPVPRAYFVKSNWCQENWALAAGDRKACRRVRESAHTPAVITANISCSRLKVTLDSFTGPAPNTVADTWMDSFQVGWIQKLWPCGKLLAVAGELNRCSGSASCLRKRGGAWAEKERRCSCCKKDSFKSQRSTTGKHPY